MALLTTCDRCGGVASRIYEEDSYLHWITLVDCRTCGIYPEASVRAAKESPEGQPAPGRSKPSSSESKS